MTTNNHPAHGPVSLDRLHQIREILSKAAAQSDGGNLGYAMADAVKVINGAIVAFGDEPVAWLLSGGGAKNNVSFDSGNAYADPLREVTPLYTASPAPVSVPDAMEMDDDFDSAFEHGKAVGWNAYRAVMLQGADRPQNEPQNIPENIPATQFKPVADLYGLTSPTCGETSFTFDAVEARDFIDGGWSCQEYVELGRFQEAMLQNGNSPAQSDCCPEQNYIAPAQDGNSPVIPDGWVLVPEEPTHEMLEAGDEQFGTYDVYRRMIEAGPKLE
ncbi:hypothetical protein KKZ74_05415 [Enterobacter hormaechei subsp. xiangfangensis]|nr:hypothetical protein [Enterobacter hormaechei subsp. xiangfangensis]